MSNWRLLTSSLNVVGSPTLLLKHVTIQSHNGKFSEHRIFLTDLTYIWTEKLDRRAIAIKALNQGTSIDPTEQFDLLLDYLRRGLDGAPQTSLKIASKSGRKELKLHLSSALPPPLKALEWDFELTQASEQVMSHEFLLPLMGNLWEASAAIQSLLGAVKDRDTAIKSIETTLQSKNATLMDLFAAQLPKGNVKAQRQRLIRKYPGLDPFDEASWRKERHDEAPQSRADTCKQLFGAGLSCKAIKDLTSHEPWWEDLDSGVDIDDPSQQSTAPALPQDTSSRSGFQQSPLDQRSSSPLSDSTESDSNPKDVGMPEKLRQPAAKDDQSDESSTDSDLDMQVAKSPKLQSFSAPRRIGTIGGRKALSPPQNPSSSLKGKSPEQPSKNVQTSSNLAGAASIDPNTGKPRSKIGIIGGARQAGPPISQSSEELSQTNQLPTRGGDSRPLKPASTSAPMPTESERADQNRADLKRELEEKRKAPVKKKRKF